MRANATPTNAMPVADQIQDTVQHQPPPLSTDFAVRASPKVIKLR
jgi:hypothetical protein